MNISRELWQQIDPLLTDALELEDGARAQWLQRLEQTHPELTPTLRKMLAAHDRAERSQELETVPKLARPPPPSSGFAAGLLIGSFALVRPLGRGGMGEVWLARQADGRVEREVALKLPTIYLHSEVWRERFHRERDILAKLAHPNIARLFDAGVSDEEGSRGQPYLAMEYIEGASLTDYVAAQKCSIGERLKLFQQILAAVAHAHRHLVVHRDLKPANILIDQSGQVKLLDFGIAKLIDDGSAAIAAADLTQMGGRVMTLRYAAPEQVTDGVISTATDTYALGVILHELLTGLSPYRAVREGKALAEASLLSEDTTMPSSLAMTSIAATERNCASTNTLSRQIAGDLDAIILKAMRKNPADRYASVEQFDQDLRRHFEHRPVKAREGTWRYLAGRFVARRKLPIAAAAAVLLTLVVGVVMVEQQRRVAVAEKARAEKHFASVRKLANSFMFDVHSEIENLAGSLKARQTLVGTALQYLDSLANEAGNDPAISAEVAVAYRKIADIQGQPGGANLGTLADSLANYEKSKVLFVALGDLKTDDMSVQREHMVLRYSLARAYASRFDARWQENIAVAVVLAKRIASMNGGTVRDRTNVAIMLAEQAHLTTIRNGPSVESEAIVDEAASILEAMLPDLPGEKVVREKLAPLYERAAEIYQANSRAPKSLTRAIETRQKALGLFADLAQEYPNEPRYSRALSTNRGYLAWHLEKAGRYREADEALTIAIEQLEALAAADRSNTGENAEILAAHGLATRIAFRQNDYDKAIRRGRAGQAYFAVMSEQLKKFPQTLNDLSGVQAYLGLALIAAADKPGVMPNHRLAGHREACTLIANALAFVEEALAGAPGAGDVHELQTYRSGLARCQSQMAKLSAR